MNERPRIAPARLRTLARRAIAGLIDRHGYELKLKRMPPRGLRGSMAHLAALGFRPETVLDVGVGRGTPWLYESFPDATYHLFEPLEEFVPWLDEICARYKARYHPCAIGAVTGTTKIMVNTAVPTSSSMEGYSAALKQRLGWRSDDIVARTIPCRRLDEFGSFRKPILLKIDVEGHELAALEGATATLAATEIVVSEISVAARNARNYSFGSFVSTIESHGFALLDIAEISTLYAGGPVAYLDAIFVRTDSLLRM